MPLQIIRQDITKIKCDVIVCPTDRYLSGAGGADRVIHAAAGPEMDEYCKGIGSLSVGEAVITPAFNMTNAKYIIHAVGPDFSRTPTAFKELFDAYYNSLLVLKENDLHSISFPLISSGIFGGRLSDPVGESTKQCCRAYQKFVADYPNYNVDVKLCAYTVQSMQQAQVVFDQL